MCHDLGTGGKDRDLLTRAPGHCSPQRDGPELDACVKKFGERSRLLLVHVCRDLRAVGDRGDRRGMRVVLVSGSRLSRTRVPGEKSPALQAAM